MLHDARLEIALEHRLTRLDDVDIVMPRTGMGTAALGGLYSSVDEVEGISAIQHAVDRGFRYFDTAPLYGQGQAEAVLGSALMSRPTPDSIVSTKVGNVVGPPSSDEARGDIFEPASRRRITSDYGPDGVLLSLEGSRQRLGSVAIDIAFVHDPQDHVHQTLTESLPALAGLRQSGTIRALGLGMSDVSCLVSLIQESTVEIDCVLIAGRYSLLTQEAAPVLFELCLQRGISVVLGGIFNSGVLAGSTNTFDYSAASPDLLSRVDRLRDICRLFDVPLAAAAAQFASAHPAVSTTLFGPRSAAELDECIDYMNVAIPETFWRALKRQELIAPHSAVPI